MLPTETKVELINRLAEAGLKSIEVGSFVSPKWVPQMADTPDVLKTILKQNLHPEVSYSVLVPNLKGYENALAAGAKEILIFTAAGETFARKNINCSVDESIERFKPIISRAHADGVRVRGCVSTIFADPYEGPVAPSKVAEIARRLHDLGCYEVMLGDTTGVGSPGSTAVLLNEVTKLVPADHLAVHFHDTYGQALPNILVALRFGIKSIDAGVAGFGGCPYAPGAAGNVATEDVVYMLHGMGIETGVDLDKLIAVGRWLGEQLGKEPVSNVSRARASNCASSLTGTKEREL